MKSFKHSGNIGDIIYSLPTLKALGGGNLHLLLNQPTGYYPGAEHPLGNVLLNEDMYNRIVPLLEHQNYIKKVKKIDLSKPITEDIFIDYDLDVFRKMPINFQAGSISRWYFYVFNVYPDLSEPWITVEPNYEYKDYIIVNRTSRYRNTQINGGINYNFLSKYQNIIFTGVESEYNEFKIFVPNSQFLQTDNFLQLAQHIAGCKAFIGNASFCFSLAEAIKMKRVLEICPFASGVIPYGKGAYDFYLQPHFESIVGKIQDGIY